MSSVTHCVAATTPGQVVWTDDGGENWNSAGPVGTAIQSLSCPDATTCFAGGTGYSQSVAVSHDGGATWTLLTTPDIVSLVSCVSEVDCFANQYGFIGMSDGGQTWQTLTTPSNQWPISGLTCSTATNCIAISAYVNTVFHSVDGGQTWNTVTVPPVTNVGFGYQNTISCPSATVCYVTDGGRTTPQTGVVIETTDGGASWSSVTLPPNNDVTGAISCPTTNVCFVIGNGYLMTDAGSAPPPQTPETSVAMLLPIAAAMIFGGVYVSRRRVTRHLGHGSRDPYST